MAHVQKHLRGAILPDERSQEVKDDNKYSKIGENMATNGEYPDFLQETMFEEHGTKYLITDPRADYYLEQARLKKLKEKYPQWTEDVNLD